MQTPAAGGGLTVATLVALRELGVPLPAAGGVAGDDEAGGCLPLGEEPPVRGDGVLERGGKRVLGRQAVVEDERPRAGRARDRRG